jgi:hypothetical protein
MYGLFLYKYVIYEFEIESLVAVSTDIEKLKQLAYENGETHANTWSDNKLIMKCHRYNEGLDLVAESCPENEAEELSLYQIREVKMV